MEEEEEEEEEEKELFIDLTIGKKEEIFSFIIQIITNIVFFCY